MRLKLSSAKWEPFCSGLNASYHWQDVHNGPDNSSPWWRHQMGNIFRVTGPLCGEFNGALMFFLIWINAWVNNHEAGDLRRHPAHYDVIVMLFFFLHYDCDVMPWKRFLHHWPFVWESIGHWGFLRESDTFSLCRTSHWTNIRVAAFFKCHDAAVTIL